MFLFIFHVFGRLGGHFEGHFATALHGADRALPSGGFRVSQFFTHVLIFHVGVTLSSYPGNLLRTVSRFQVRVLIGPTVCRRKFVFRQRRRVSNFLNNANFCMANSWLPFTVLLRRVLPFPATFGVFGLLVFRDSLGIAIWLFARCRLFEPIGGEVSVL